MGTRSTASVPRETLLLHGTADVYHGVLPKPTTTDDARSEAEWCLAERVGVGPPGVGTCGPGRNSLPPSTKLVLGATLLPLPAPLWWSLPLGCCPRAPTSRLIVLLPSEPSGCITSTYLFVPPTGPLLPGQEAL